LYKAWQEKIPERSEDDFLLANQPAGSPCPIRRTRTIFAGKKLKYEFPYGTNRKGLETYIGYFISDYFMFIWFYGYDIVEV
jgi:hypothetical protein